MPERSSFAVCACFVFVCCVCVLFFFVAALQEALISYLISLLEVSGFRGVEGYFYVLRLLGLVHSGLWDLGP